MLFDLRSRGRRRTVWVIYAGLAVLMFGGLVLFGVGAGTGIGGLLNAFTNNASNSNHQVIDQETRAALRETKKNPIRRMPGLRWFRRGGVRPAPAPTSTTPPRSTRLRQTPASACGRRLGAIPDAGQVAQPRAATLAARAYSTIANWNGAAGAWEFVANAEPTAPSPFVCLAATAYAAKQTRKGDLAAAQAVSLAPKLQRLQLKQELKAAKTSTTVAQSCG